MAETVKTLLCIVKDADCDKLVELASQNKSKKSNFTFKEILKELTIDEIDDMWELLNEIVIKRAESIFELSHNKSKVDSPTKKSCQDVNQVIQAAIDLAVTVFEHSMPASEGLLHMVVFLNRIILEVPGSMENLRNNIALLCEKMFFSNYLQQDHEYIIFNTVIYLLRRSLLPKAPKKVVKRIYSLRFILPKVLTMKEVNANEVSDLMKKCVVSSLYLSMPEGQKVISTMLGTDVDHLPELHSAIKQYIPSATLKQGSAYGRAYLEAWSDAVKQDSEPLQNELEVGCLQDFILMAVNGRQRSLVAVLRKLLAQFNSQKKEVHVAKMLYLQYQPILWRFIKNPDGLIRANTAQLFLDIFPLEDPDSKFCNTDLELNEQLLLIQDLLLDEFPIVRTTAVIGLCIAMSLNWELFPEDMLKTYFQTIVNELSCDSSSNDVRCAVAKGFKVLLENPLTLPTLQVILPRINGLFHDISDPVRIAFCQLLLRVKKISAIKYYEIVPLTHLLARMEEDPVVVKSIVNLIHNSYFPKTEGPEIWLARCIDLINMDRGASRVFFQYISNFVPLESIAKFMIQAVKTVHFYVKMKASQKDTCVLSYSRPRQRCMDSSTDSDMSDLEALEEGAHLHDPNVVSGIMDAVAILWLSCVSSLEKPENKNLLKLLVSRLAKCLAELSIYYKDTSMWQSVYYLSSFMPSRHVPSLPSLCFFRLKQLRPDTSPEEYVTLLECLCNQGESDGLLKLLKEWMEAGFLPPPQVPAPKKRKSKQGRKSGRGKDDPPIPVSKHLLAVQMLHSMLDHRSCQKTIITRNPDMLKEMLHFVDDIKSKVEASREKNISLEEADFLTKMLSALLTIAVLLHSEGKHNGIKYAEEVIRWILEKLLKQSNDSCMETSVNASRTRSDTEKIKQSASFEQLTLAISKNVCTVITDMTLMGFLNVKSLKFVKFGMKLLCTEYAAGLLVPVCKLLHKHVSYGVFAILQEDSVNILNIVPDCFNKIIQCLSDEDFLDAVPTSDLKEVQSLLARCLELMHQHVSLKELLTSITVSFTKSILNSILSNMDNWQDIEKKCNPFENIPLSKFGAFLLSTVCLKPKMIVYFLQQLQRYLAKAGKDIQSWVACYVVIINVWEIKNMSKGINKEMQCLVDKMEGLLLEHHPQSSVDQNLPLAKDAQDDVTEKDDVVEKALKSFEEHCQFEYKKLKDLLLQKTSDP